MSWSANSCKSRIAGLDGQDASPPTSSLETTPSTRSWSFELRHRDAVEVTASVAPNSHRREAGAVRPRWRRLPVGRHPGIANRSRRARSPRRRHRRDHRPRRAARVDDHLRRLMRASDRATSAPPPRDSARRTPRSEVAAPAPATSVCCRAA